MKGDPKVIEYLQKSLKLELTAINQYFLHARMYEDMGFFEIGKKEYQESIEEMQHADRFIKRILFLTGLPNLQDLGKLRIGENPKEMLECDLAAEYEGHAYYKEAITHCEQVGDYVTRELFAEILVGLGAQIRNFQKVVEHVVSIESHQRIRIEDNCRDV